MHGITTTVRSFTVFQVIGMPMAEKIAISPVWLPAEASDLPEGVTVEDLRKVSVKD
ncbi:hypothetical protein HORIV_35800 [Vreelandella olivaria]|uniref:Uncharacterized protein n=1 Tax=Vreelandella olivaria TaxID=390919 RepID=A0ABM7GKG7_9GAMM|nr:hypothetical protein HORIV_35800 [Halomonas olivaria]